MKWKKYLEETVDPDDVDIKSVAVKDELDPVIWDDKQSLKSYLADHLYKIAKDFFSGFGLEWELVEDVTITGSLANYNWSKYSDVDLHLIIDYSAVDENEKLVRDFFTILMALYTNVLENRISKINSNILIISGQFDQIVTVDKA